MYCWSICPGLFCYAGTPTKIKHNFKRYKINLPLLLLYLSVQSCNPGYEDRPTPDELYIHRHSVVEEYSLKNTDNIFPTQYNKISQITLKNGLKLSSNHKYKTIK